MNLTRRETMRVHVVLVDADGTASAVQTVTMPLLGTSCGQAVAAAKAAGLPIPEEYVLHPSSEVSRHENPEYVIGPYDVYLLEVGPKA